MDVMRCSHCGWESHESVRFCGQCGQPMAKGSERPSRTHDPDQDTPTRDLLGRGAGVERPAPTPPAPAASVPAPVPSAPPEPEPGITSLPKLNGPIEPGTLVGGRYEIRGFLGRGGMGAVMSAHDRLVGEEVAVKFMHPFFVHGEEGVKRFLREGRLARKLNHPNIVRTMNIESHGSLTVIVMERLHGKTLRELVREYGLPAPVDFVLGLGDQVLAALEAAHANGIVHRDIKPQNIWIEDDREPRVKVMDFGLAKDMAPASADVTMVPRLLGTPSYMAPEQGHLGGAVDHRADLHSLAVVLHELLTAALPGSLVDDAVPDPLQPVLQRALAKRPEDRFQTASEMRLAWQAAMREMAAAEREATERAAAASAPSQARVVAPAAAPPASPPPPRETPGAAPSPASAPLPPKPVEREKQARRKKPGGVAPKPAVVAPVAVRDETPDTPPPRPQPSQAPPAPTLGQPRPGAVARWIVAGVTAVVAVLVLLAAWQLTRRTLPGGPGASAAPGASAMAGASMSTSGSISASAPAGPSALATAPGPPVEPAPSTGTWAELTEWLASHPDHPQRQAVADLREKLVATARAQADAARAALLAGDLARARIALDAGRSAQPELAEWKAIEELLADETTWQRVVDAKSLEGVKRFRAEHPGSRHEAQAVALVAQLEAEAKASLPLRQLNDLVAKGSLEEIDALRKKLPEGELRARATKELRALATERVSEARERALTAARAGSLSDAETARKDAAAAATLGDVQVDLADVDAELDDLRLFQKASAAKTVDLWRAWLVRPGRSSLRERDARAGLAAAVQVSLEQILAKAAGHPLTDAEQDRALALVAEGRQADARAAAWDALAKSVQDAGKPPVSLESVRSLAEKGDLTGALGVARASLVARPADREARLWVAALRAQIGGEVQSVLPDLAALQDGSDHAATAARILVRELTPPAWMSGGSTRCWACGFPVAGDTYQCPHCLWVQPHVVSISLASDRGSTALRWSPQRLERATSELKASGRQGARAPGNPHEREATVVELGFTYENGLLRLVASRDAGGPTVERRISMPGSPWRKVAPVDVLLDRNVKAVRLTQLANLTPYLPWSAFASFEPTHDANGRLQALRDVDSGASYAVEVDAAGRLLSIRQRGGPFSRRLTWKDGRLRGEELTLEREGTVVTRKVSHETDGSGAVKRTTLDLPDGNVEASYK